MRTYKSSSRNNSRRVKSYCNTCFKVCLLSLVVGLLVISFALVIGVHDGSHFISDFFEQYLGRLHGVRNGDSQSVQIFESKEADTKTLTDSAQNVGKADNRTFWQKAQLPSTRRVNHSSPRALLEARKILDSHPFNHLPANQTIGDLSLQEAMLYLSKQPQCKKKPIFTSMAQVGTDLYWQLIENFIFSMVKFSISDCSVMICVTDMHCMDLCKKAGFPCLYYDHVLHNPKEKVPSALEQIAHLKLFHLPKALSLGVDIMMMDLDVGLLQSPMRLIEGFYNPESPLFKMDLMMQRDVTFIMHRTVELWKTWYTRPMPNIGLFLIRGSPMSLYMFSLAWRDYRTTTADIKHNPGKDQNKVVEAMNSIPLLKWSYFPSDSAVLLDKIHKFEDKSFELGGEAAAKLFNKKNSVAVHTTCYEQKSKVMGLKAANAFWNPAYYDPNRRTITKKLLYGEWLELSNELKSLMYLAIITDRTLIIPNILGSEGLEGPNVQLFNGLAMWPGFRVAHISGQREEEERRKKKMERQERKRKGLPKGTPREDKSGVTNTFLFNERNAAAAPVSPSKVVGGDVLDLLTIVEPAYYWRVGKDYSSSAPDPSVISFLKTATLQNMEDYLLSSAISDLPRIVINMDKNKRNKKDTLNAGVALNVHNSTLRRLISWANDSVGTYRSYDTEYADYLPLPKLLHDRARNAYKSALRNLIIDAVRPCHRMLETNRGNRSCFDKCQ